MRPREVAVALAVLVAVVAPTAVRAEATNETVRFEAPFGAVHGWFGRAVAIDGDRAFVAGYEFDDTDARFGAVSEFIRTESGWTRGAVLRATRPSDYFGVSLALEGDVLAVGAFGYCDPGDDSTPGQVHVFRRIEGVWQPDGVIEGGSCRLFGLSVDLAADVLVIGTTSDDGGSTGAFVYERIDGTWTETGYFDPPADAGDSFGAEVATDGTFVVVGDPWRTPGRVHIFERAGGTWAPVTRLSAPGGVDSFSFGDDIAIDGGTLVVSAHSEGDDAGAVYVFDAAEGWAPEARLSAAQSVPGDQFGWSIALAGDSIAVGARSATVNGVERAGAAYLFERSDGDWEQAARLEASSASAGSALGTAIAVDGRELLAGTPYQDTGCGEGGGAAYLFDLDALGSMPAITGECRTPVDRRGPITTVTSPAAVSTAALQVPISGGSVGRAAPVVQVLVTLRHVNSLIRRTFEADLACDGYTCTWCLDPPVGVLGLSPSAVYYVTAQGVDELGNTGESSPEAVVIVAGYP